MVGLCPRSPTCRDIGAPPYMVVRRGTQGIRSGQSSPEELEQRHSPRHANATLEGPERTVNRVALCPDELL